MQCLRSQPLTNLKPATKQSQQHNCLHQTTKNDVLLPLSFLTLFLTIGAVTGNVRGARNLSQITTSATTTVSPTLLADSLDSTDEVCFRGCTNAAEEQLVELLIHRLLGTFTSDETSKVSSLPTVSQAAPGIPNYVVGCSIFNWKCMECSLCEDVYGALVETGSKAASDAGCILLVETIGGGPLDRKSLSGCRAKCSINRPNPHPKLTELLWTFLIFVVTAIADFVAKVCIPLSAEIFDKALPSAHAACAAVDLCSN